MSKALDAAIAAFDADLANPNTQMSEAEIKEVLGTLTDKDDQIGFVKHMMASAMNRAKSEVNLQAVTEFFTSLSELPEGFSMTREKFEELAVDLSAEDRVYVAQLLMKEQERRSGGQDNPLAAAGVRPEAIKVYTDKLGKIIKVHGMPTRSEYAEIQSDLNEAEKEVIAKIQAKLSGGAPLPFRGE